MAYTLNRGVGKDGMNRMQRGLLMGLPAIAIILSFGAIFHHGSNNRSGLNPQVIPIVSAAKQSSGKTSPSNNSSGSKGGASSSGPGTASLTTASSSTPAYSAPALASGSTSSSSAPLVGGRGGGPTGGGTSGTSGGTSTGGGSAPTSSVIGIGTTCGTTTCTVTGCTQPETISYGEKVILGLSGLCTVEDP